MESHVRGLMTAHLSSRKKNRMVSFAVKGAIRLGGGTLGHVRYCSRNKSPTSCGKKGGGHVKEGFLLMQLTFDDVFSWGLQFLKGLSPSLNNPDPSCNTKPSTFSGPQIQVAT